MNATSRYLSLSIGLTMTALLASGAAFAESPKAPAGAASPASAANPDFTPCRGMSGQQLTDCRTEQRARARNDWSSSGSSGSSGGSGSSGSSGGSGGRTSDRGAGTMSGGSDANATPGATPPTTGSGANPGGGTGSSR